MWKAFNMEIPPTGWLMQQRGAASQPARPPVVKDDHSLPLQAKLTACLLGAEGVCASCSGVCSLFRDVFFVQGCNPCAGVYYLFSVYPLSRNIICQGIQLCIICEGPLTTCATFAQVCGDVQYP